MNRSRVAIGVVGGGVALGIWADVLFYGQPLGLNVLFWTAAFAAGLAALLRVARAPLHQGRRWMLGPLLLFAAAFLWHASTLLVAANLLALAGAVSLGALRRGGPPVRRAALTDYAAGLVAAGSSAVAGSLRLLQEDVRWEQVHTTVRAERMSTIGRGVAVGLPLLALFGGLFMAADAVFRNLVTTAVPSAGDALQHTLVVAVAAWLTAGLLRDLLAVREAERLLSPAVLAARRVPFSFGTTEIGIVLGALNILFLAFVIVQFRYLFGGPELVQARAHLTYAEYARHGFFELLAVSGLVLLVLLAADALLSRTPTGGERIVRLLAGGLVALVFVVIASALQRMHLYEQTYGLTQLRIYAIGVILWLGVVFAWFALTVLRGRRHAFAVGAVVAGFAATAALNVLNPDALIARTNLERSRVDVAYLSGLSDDAVPVLLERLPSLRGDLRRALATALLERSREADGWRSFNVARSRADALLTERRDELLRLSR